MPDSRSEILDLLGGIQSLYGNYHNHKETSAWAAVALYAVVLSQVANAIARGLLPSYRQRAWAAVAVTVLSTLVCVYLFGQFRLRKRAADFVAACIHLGAEVD